MMRTVARERVRNRLHEATQYPVAILRAPAGFGKSTELRRFADEHPSVVRYTLTSEIRTPWAFLRGLVAALFETVPGLTFSLAGAWERAAASQTPAEHLARWLYSHIGKLDLTIAIDQVHFAGADRLVQDLITRIVDLRTGSIRWIFSTRDVIDLPIPRWMANGVMDLPIDADVLRFDAEDTAKAAALWHRSYGDGTIDDVLRGTGGWPMGVMFALRSAASGRQGVVDYRAESFNVLAERAFSDRSDRQRDFLLATCVFSTLDDDLCRRVGFADASQLLRALESDAGLIFAESGSVRQYHDSFAQYLQHALRERGAVHVQAVLGNAISALVELGRPGEALGLAIRYEQQGQVARLLERHGFELMQYGDEQVVLDALSALGAPSDQWSAQALALKAIFESRAGRLDTSDAWLYTALERTNDAGVRAEIAYRGASEMLQRRRTGALDLLDLDAVTEDVPLPLRVSILSAKASAAMQAGDSAQANACIEQALELADRVEDQHVIVALHVRAAYVSLYSGERDRAKTFALRGALLAEECSQFQMACAAYSTLYAAAADEDEPAQCLEYLARLAENAAKSGNPRMQLYALMARFDLETERGDFEALAQLRRSLASFDVNYEELDTTETILPSRAMQLAWEGRFEDAYRLLLPSAQQQIEPDRAALRWSEIALYAAACRQQAARDALSKVRREFREDGARTVRSDRAQIYSVCALALLGRYNAARTLADALSRVPLTPRNAALCEAAAQFARALGEERNELALDRALNALHRCDAGGIATVLLAMPLPERSRRQRPSAATQLREGAEEFAASLAEISSFPEERSLGFGAGLQVLAERLCEYVDDRNGRSLEAWLDEFAVRYGGAQALRTALSMSPQALEEFLARRGFRADPLLSDLRRIVHRTVLRPQRPMDAAASELVDEIDAAINELIARLDTVDALTAEHSRAVSSWCARLARMMGMGADEVTLASRSGLIHDIGKIRTPIEVLTAPRKLTLPEWQIMREHVEAGEDIVRGISPLSFLSVAVRSHHERIDGKGYPDGTAGSKIPFIARLVAVADSFNAMIGRRPYRRPMPPSIALEELQRHRGTQFDPEIAGAMIVAVTSQRSQTCA
jgi:HD-GYP domain-containing protein (c-di-GMP phosphodiesterase class II)/ATP/maltotriose-dependent transcriptional regulator MalT